MNDDMPEVNGSTPPMLPGSFLREKEPGYEAMYIVRSSRFGPSRQLGIPPALTSFVLFVLGSGKSIHNGLLARHLSYVATPAREGLSVTDLICWRQSTEFQELLSVSW